MKLMAKSKRYILVSITEQRLQLIENDHTLLDVLVATAKKRARGTKR
jgi:DNA-directed RNA polymerase subunit L